MSNFKNILSIHKKQASESVSEEASPPSPALEPEPELEAQTTITTKPPKLPTAEKKRGRPSGKRTDPKYQQVTAYIRKSTYKSVKLAILRQDDSPEFSELVEELLSKWLKAKS